jgi:hypothetical protein
MNAQWDAYLKNLTPRILNLEQNKKKCIKGNDFVPHVSMYSNFVQYIQYVCTVPKATYSITIERANYLFFGALKTYS